MLYDLQSVLSDITSGSDSAALSKMILLQKCRSNASYGKKRLKGTGKLYYAIDPRKKTLHFSTAECKILHSSVFSFVDKFSVSVTP